MDYKNPFTDMAPNVKLLISFKILGIILLTNYHASFRFSFETEHYFFTLRSANTMNE
jgi:hypothetical protein